MGKKKDKKEKKKKKKRYEENYNEYEDDYYSRSTDKSSRNYADERDRDNYYVEDVRSSSKSHKDRVKYENRKKERKNVPLTEEYVYDFSGQEMMQGSRDMSISPERPKDRKHELTPPPPPPGMDWPFEAPKAPVRPKSPMQVTEDPEWLIREEKNRDREYQNEVDRKYKEKQREEKRQYESSVAATTDTSAESLSIEETNKLRAKLGLKPLQVESATSNEEKKEKSYADREDTHLPATNIGQKRNADKMREKMEAIREKRKINKKLQRIKGLGEADDDPVLDSAAAWVAKSRMQEKERLMAVKRAQMLEEMDEEFGISDLVNDSVVSRIKREPEYSYKDLKGLRVEHRGTSFQEGVNTVLTLKDRGILEEGDDDEEVLVNVNILDDERAKENVKNRSKRPGYKAYDEVDEETGDIRIRGLLDKYDEEIDGVKKASFRLDNAGQADLEGENEMERIRATLKSQQVSLEMAAPQLAREYFTEEEMVKFKKPRKKIRKVVRKRNMVKADDLLRLNLDTKKDRGSRLRKSELQKKFKENHEDESMDIVPAVPDELDYFVVLNMKEENNDLLIEEDEAENELQLALERSRRSKQKNKDINEDGDRIEKIAQEVLSKPKKEEIIEEQVNTTKGKKKGRESIILDSTSEFCRTLGDLPTVGPPPPKVEEENLEDMDIDELLEQAQKKGGWEQVELNGNRESNKDAEEEDEEVLESEPLPTGMAATLNLAEMKGYLKDGKEKVRKFDPLNLPETKAEVDLEKLRDEERSRYTRGYDRDRDRYDPYAFKEKSNYKPDVKLEYVDGKGRQLNQKEAFRLLSHKFHGKGSGKHKTEKRAKKILEHKNGCPTKGIKPSFPDGPLPELVIANLGHAANRI